MEHMYAEKRRLTSERQSRIDKIEDVTRWETYRKNKEALFKR